MTDPAGAAITNAAITIVERSTGRTQTVTTDAAGNFIFQRVPAGRYSIKASAAGFSNEENEIELSSGDRSINVQLNLSAATATVEISSTVADSELGSVPGGVASVNRREVVQSAAVNLRDVLGLTPGVLAQPRYGSDELQISIRGSGLRNNYHLRGVNIFINGMPYGDADGFSDFESIELLTANSIRVWKGANALRYGGNAAGGAIDLQTETGATAFPLEVRLQGGSYGAYKGYVSTGGEFGPFGYFLSVSDSELKGYREHGHQGRRRLFGNFTYKLSEDTEMFADLIFANFAEKYPGSLTYEEFIADPRQANAENVLQDYGRFANYYRGAFGLRHRLGSRHEVSFNASAQYRDLIHPIFNFLDQDTRTFAGEFRYAYGGSKHRFTAGFTPQVTLTGGRRFENLGGVRGPQAAHFDWVATNYGLFFDDQYDITPSLTISAGGRFDRSKRRNTDLFLSDGDGSDRRIYQAFSPKIGLLWRANDRVQVFGNVSRSYEPPLILELTSFGFEPGFLPLKAQDSWQAEIGTRGSIFGDRLRYELSVYNAEIKNEVLNQNLQPFPGAPFTIPSFRGVERSRHTGVEVSVDAAAARSLFTEYDELSLRTAFTYADFRFVRDANFSGNRIPGQPRHLLRSEVRYDYPQGFWIAPAIDWSPASYFVNSANTYTNGSYAAVNLKAGFESSRFGIFIDAANLLDRNYSASVVVDDAALRFYEPANGRSITAGFVYRFGSR